MVGKLDLAPLEDLVGRHGEVTHNLQTQVVRGKGSQLFQTTICLLLGRSQKLARDALCLLKRGSWEAAALISRVVFEDAGVLGYINAQGRKKKQFAALYAKSVAWEREQFLKRWPSSEELADRTSKQRNLSEREAKQFEILRDELWTGARNGNGTPRFTDKNAWNGLTVKDTWKEAEPLSSYTYFMWYQTSCRYAHSSALVFGWAFATEFGMATPEKEAEQAAIIARILLMALVAEMQLVDGLVKITPALGLPTDDELEAMVARVLAP